MRWAPLFVVLVACKQSAPAPEVQQDVMTLDAASVSQISVDVRADGSLALNGFTVKNDSELTELTRALARDKPVLHAVIHVDQGVAYDRVIAAEHALKQGGVTHMSFGGFGAQLDAAYGQ